MNFETLFEQLNSAETITLNQLYDGDTPDSNELLWNFIGFEDFDSPLTIHTLNYSDIFKMFQDKHGIKKVSDLNALLSRSQKALVKKLQSKRDLAEDIIIICNGVVVDGNHRALATLLNQSTIRYVNLEEL